MTFSFEGGRPPVIDESDLLAVFPNFMKKNDSAPVRDAIVTALVTTFGSYQSFAEYAAAQCDLLRATGIYLREKCAEIGVFPVNDSEDDDSLRARALSSTRPSVTPNAIVAAVNAILAQVTPKTCQYMEAIRDNFFCFSRDTTQPLGTPANPAAMYFLGAQSINPSKLGAVSTDGPAWIYGDSYGRYFVLRIPMLIDDLSNRTFFVAGQTPLIVLTTNPSNQAANSSYLYSGGQQILDIYNTIVNTVDRLKGASIRWQLFADPSL